MTDVANAPTPIHDSIVNAQASPGTVDAWWSTPDADEVEGYDLLKDDALYQVVGVPFMVTRAVFRDGIQRKGNETRDDYVSIEIRVAPQIAWDISRITQRRRALELPDGTPVAHADEQLVLNDGSTGLYRQIVQYLAAKGMITLPNGDEEGEKGDSIFDLPRSEWQEGADEGTKGFDIKLRCSRGLRFSDYKNQYTGDDEARTWYIA